VKTSIRVSRNVVTSWSDDESGQHTDSDEQRAFGQQLQHHAAARRAYRQPNGDLFQARGRLRDLQARDVRAGNREQQNGHRHDR
jgi:hypothetical protein